MSGRVDRDYLLLSNILADERDTEALLYYYNEIRNNPEFEKQLFHFDPRPWFVPHGKDHARAVFSNTQALLLMPLGVGWPRTLLDVLTPLETRCVLYAALLHDIGMCFPEMGREELTTPESQKRWQIEPVEWDDARALGILRKHHGLLSCIMIMNPARYHMRVLPLFTPAEQRIVAEICRRHQRWELVKPTNPTPPIIYVDDDIGVQDRVHLGLLAGLVALADACDTRRTRIPDLYRLQESTARWQVVVAANAGVVDPSPLQQDLAEQEKHYWKHRSVENVRVVGTDIYLTPSDDAFAEREVSFNDAITEVTEHVDLLRSVVAQCGLSPAAVAAVGRLEVKLGPPAKGRLDNRLVYLDSISNPVAVSPPEGSSETPLHRVRSVLELAGAATDRRLVSSPRDFRLADIEREFRIWVETPAVEQWAGPLYSLDQFLDSAASRVAVVKTTPGADSTRFLFRWLDGQVANSGTTWDFVFIEPAFTDPDDLWTRIQPHFAAERRTLLVAEDVARVDGVTPADSARGWQRLFDLVGNSACCKLLAVADGETLECLRSGQVGHEPAPVVTSLPELPVRGSEDCSALAAVARILTRHYDSGPVYELLSMVGRLTEFGLGPKGDGYGVTLDFFRAFEQLSAGRPGGPDPELPRRLEMLRRLHFSAVQADGTPEYRMKRIWVKVLRDPAIEFKVAQLGERDKPSADRIVQAAVQFERTADRFVAGAVALVREERAMPGLLADLAKLNDAGKAAAEAEVEKHPEVSERLLATLNQTWFDKAQKAWRAGQYEEAAGCYVKAHGFSVLLRNPERTSFYSNRTGDCLAALNRPQEALEYYEAALEEERKEKGDAMLGRAFGNYFTCLRQLWEGRDNWPQGMDATMLFLVWERRGLEAIRLAQKPRDTTSSRYYLKKWQNYLKNFSDLAECYRVWGEHIWDRDAALAERKLGQSLEQLDRAIEVARQIADLVADYKRERGGLNYLIDQRSEILRMTGSVREAGAELLKMAQTEAYLSGVLHDARRLLELASRGLASRVPDIETVRANLDLARRVIDEFDRRVTGATPGELREEDDLLHEYLSAWMKLLSARVDSVDEPEAPDALTGAMRAARDALRLVLTRFNDWYEMHESDSQRFSDVRQYVDDLYQMLGESSESLGDYLTAVGYFEDLLTLRSMDRPERPYVVAYEYLNYARRFIDWADRLESLPDSQESGRDTQDLPWQLVDKARIFLDEAVRRMPVHAPSLRLRARVHHRLGRLEQAAKDWEAASRLGGEVAGRELGLRLSPGKAWVGQMLDQMLDTAVHSDRIEQTSDAWQSILEVARSGKGQQTLKRWLSQGGQAPDTSQLEGMLLNSAVALRQAGQQGLKQMLTSLLDGEVYHRDRLSPPDGTMLEALLHRLFYVIIRTLLFRDKRLELVPGEYWTWRSQCELVPLGQSDLKKDWRTLAGCFDRYNADAVMRVPDELATKCLDFSVELDLEILEKNRKQVTAWLSLVVDAAFDAAGNPAVLAGVRNKGQEIAGALEVWLRQDAPPGRAVDALRIGVRELGIAATTSEDAGMRLRLLLKEESEHGRALGDDSLSPGRRVIHRLLYAVARTMVVNDPALVRVMPALTNLRRGMAEIEVDVLYSDWLSVAQAIEEANGALRFRLKDELINRCRTAAAQSVSVCIARERQEKEALGCWLVAMVNTASHDVSSIAAGCEAALKEVGTGLTDLAVHRWLRQCADEEKAESALQAADQTLEELWRAGERMPEQRAEELCRRELFHQDALTRMTGKNKKYRPATPIFLLHSTLRALVRTTLQKDRDVAAVLRNDPVGALRRKHKLGPVNASALSKEWSMCGDLAEKCNRRFRVKTPYVFACRCQELARELDADNLAAWFHLGWQQLYMGRYDDAAKSFREIDDRRGYEAYPTALAGLAKVYENRREFEAAAEYYTRCSRLQLSNWEGLIETISQVLDQLADPAVCLAVILNTLGTAALSASEDIGGKRDRGLEWLRQLEQGESAPEETGAQSGAASGEVGAVLIVYRPAVIDKFRQQLDICRRKLAENLPKGARNLWNLAITMDSDAVSTKVLCVQRALELYQRYCMYVRDSDESVAARERVALLTKQLRRLRPPS